MTQKVDIKTLRTSATGSVSGGPARLRQLQVKSGGSGNPRIVLLNGDGGEELLDITFTNSDLHSVNIPGNGIRFDSEIWLNNKANITAMTFFWS